jgi:DNA-binding response OmpR family regulator
MIAMTFARSVLIVEPDRSQGSAAKQVLESAGFDVNCVETFDEAERLLACGAPDVLITSLRLGAYNGLHLVLNRCFSSGRES